MSVLEHISEDSMSPGAHSLMLAGAIVLAAANVTPATAQDLQDPDQANQSDQNAAEEASQPEARAYVLRYGAALDPEQIEAARNDLNIRLKDADAEATVEANVPGLRGDLITTTLSPEEISEKLPPGAVAAPLPDLPVELFDGASCEDAEQASPYQPLPNICRVTGQPATTTSGRKVWIIDSGVSMAANEALNVVGRVNCPPGGACRAGASATAVRDRLGHGSMVAGIIGAKPFSDGTGIKGVSPEAPIVIVKVFDNRADANFWLAPRRGLEYVAENAAAGDVANISFGVPFFSGLSKQGFEALRVFDTLMAKMADKGIRVVIAAGNAAPRDPLPPWVGFLSPQNMTPSHGAQSNINPSGGVYVVSAVDSQWDSDHDRWVDTFWGFSYFGDRPPEFSEPGVNIKSLWRGNKRTAFCSGTSFAAPHLSGLLQRLDVDELNTDPSTGDPVAIADPVAYANPGPPC
jgi:subtilisin family serine protease